MRNFKRSLELERVRGNKLGLAINLNNIGAVYQTLDDYDKAVEYYRKSLDKTGIER